MRGTYQFEHINLVFLFGLFVNTIVNAKTEVMTKKYILNEKIPHTGDKASLDRCG